MNYCHVCLAQYDKELEFHIDRLNDIAAKKQAVNKSDIMTFECKKLWWTLSHGETLHSVNSKFMFIGHGVSQVKPKI